jgi:hypothetical protein
VIEIGKTFDDQINGRQPLFLKSSERRVLCAQMKLGRLACWFMDME